MDRTLKLATQEEKTNIQTHVEANHTSAQSDEMLQLVDNITAHGDGNLSLVNDILDRAKLQHGEVQLKMAHFDLRSCMESALAIATAMPKASTVELRYFLPCDLTIRGDSNRLRQILFNLLSNAIKFTEQGSIVLTCAVTRMGLGFELNFMVEDTGIGISPEESKGLMKEVRQVRSMINQEINGTRLGLVVTQQLLKAMGATLELKSVPGQGSQFFFTLKCEATIHKPPLETQRRSALIIHPSREEGKCVQRHCESLGMKVCQETSG